MYFARGYKYKYCIQLNSKVFFFLFFSLSLLKKCKSTNRQYIVTKFHTVFFLSRTESFPLSFLSQIKAAFILVIFRANIHPETSFLCNSAQDNRGSENLRTLLKWQQETRRNEVISVPEAL